MLNTVYAPSTVTTDETFLWYSVDERLSLGIAHLYKQNALRVLGTYQMSPETDRLPSTHFSYGVQGIATGNPGASLTAEKNFAVETGNLNLFLGLGYRTNIRKLSGVGGIKWSPDGRISIGYQNDGVSQYPFLTYNIGAYVVGGYLIDYKALAILVGTRF